MNANGTNLFPTTDEAVTNTPATISTSNPSSSLTQPIPLLGGGNNKNYMNISFDSDVRPRLFQRARIWIELEVGDHDPQQRGFNARNIEIAFDGAVDPYFEGFANIVFKLDNNNETEDRSWKKHSCKRRDLPFSLQLKGGQFFAAFGRINPTHPHTWDFADAPLVHGRLLGPDGLARSRRANFLDDSRAVVFAGALRGAERARRNRLLIS